VAQVILLKSEQAEPRNQMAQPQFLALLNLQVAEQVAVAIQP
jgi:hypothetical protein